MTTKEKTKEAKIQMYLSLGYKVYDMNDKEIKN